VDCGELLTVTTVLPDENGTPAKKAETVLAVIFLMFKTS
jgi:hypothetical protein